MTSKWIEKNLKLKSKPQNSIKKKLVLFHFFCYITTKLPKTMSRISRKDIVVVGCLFTHRYLVTLILILGKKYSLILNKRVDGKNSTMKFIKNKKLGCFDLYAVLPCIIYSYNFHVSSKSANKLQKSVVFTAKFVISPKVVLEVNFCKPKFACKVRSLNIRGWIELKLQNASCVKTEHLMRTQSISNESCTH